MKMFFRPRIRPLLWLTCTVLIAPSFSCSAGSPNGSGSGAPGDGDQGNPSHSGGASSTGASGGSIASGDGDASGGSDGPSIEPCTGDNECSSGQICQFGACRAAACTEDADCDPGRVCEAGRCAVETCEPPLIPFTFIPTEEQDPDEVFLAGSMNGWSSAKLASWALVQQDDGTWYGEFDVAAGQHSYKYQLYTAGDGPEWVSDSTVEAWADDGFAGRNSLIAVACDGLDPIEVECTTDEECEEGEICGTIACVAAQCQTEADCTEGLVCDAGRCASPPNLCDNGHSHQFHLAAEDLPGDGAMGGAPGSASEVLVAGDFTSWGENPVAMTFDGDAWTLTWEMTGGLHEYKFVVDGVWILDPNNDAQRNGNSLIELPCEAGAGGAGGESAVE